MYEDGGAGVSSKAVLVLLAVLALVVVAVVAVRRETQFTTRTAEHALIVDQAGMAEVARIEIRHGASAIDLLRDGDNWKIATADGFPASAGAVRSLVVGLSQMEISESMTSQSSRYAELDLAWPDERGAAQLVRLLRATGEPVCEIVLGRQRAKPSSQAVRLLGATECVRVHPPLVLDVSTKAFIDHAGLAIPEAPVTRVLFDGLVLTALAPEPALQPAAAPSAATPKDWIESSNGTAAWSDAQIARAKGALPSFLSRLDFEDVRLPASPSGETCDSERVMVFASDEALVTLNLRQIGEAMWVGIEIAAPSASAALSGKWQEFAARTTGWEFLMSNWKSRQVIDMRNEGAAVPSTESDSGGTLIPPAH